MDHSSVILESNLDWRNYWYNHQAYPTSSLSLYTDNQPLSTICEAEVSSAPQIGVNKMVIKTNKKFPNHFYIILTNQTIKPIGVSRGSPSGFNPTIRAFSLNPN